MRLKINPTRYVCSPESIFRILTVFICLHFLTLNVFEVEAAVVEHSGTISAHTTWSGSDIHLVTGNVTVSTGIILTMEPGAIVKFNPSTYLNVNGALYAVGNPSEKIVFTSYRDDSFGGDTNDDGFSAGQPADWGRIYFSGSVTESQTRLEHTIIRFGGSGGQGNIYMVSSDVPVVFSDISYGSSYGIYTLYASPLIEGNTISDNGSYGIYHYRTSSPVDRNNTITGNSNGIYVQQSSTPTIDGNTITDNSEFGIYYYDAPNAPVITGNTRSMLIPASSVPSIADGNVLAPNSINGVWIRGNLRSSDLLFDVLYSGEAYEINTYMIYGTLTMDAGNTLTVDPGVVVKFDIGAGLNINGALSAVGTSALPVVFTSYKDDQYGGDLDVDGYSTSPENGDWRGIYFSNLATDVSCIVDHAVIRYGGSANSGAVYSNQTDLTIQNSVISNSSSNGVRASQASLTLSNNEFFGNSGDGAYLPSSGDHTDNRRTDLRQLWRWDRSNRERQFNGYG